MAKSGTRKPAKKSAAKKPATPKKVAPKRTVNKKSPTKRATRTSKQSVAQRARAKNLTRIKRYGAFAVAAAVLLTVWIGVQYRIDHVASDWAHERWLASTRAMGFEFQELLVEGRELTHVNAVVDAVQLMVGDSLFMVSLDDIRDRLLAIDTVKNASVTRDLSGRIKVTLVERRPFALWQHRGRLQVVDEEGVVLLYEDPQNYAYLVTIVGAQAPAHINHLVGLLSSDSMLAEKVVAAVFVSERRWDIHLDSGLQIMLPEDNPETAWKKLADMQRRHDVLTHAADAIDLRIDNRMFITVPDAESGESNGAPSDA